MSEAGDLGWTVASFVLLFVLVGGLAGSVETQSFWEKFSGRGRISIAIGLVCQFFVLPFLGFAAVRLYRVHPVVGVMLMVTTSSPGGSYSNWWCSLCNADLALSVAMTTVSSVVSAFMLPFNLFLYVTLLFDEEGAREVPIDWSSLAISIAVVVAGIGTGLFLGYKLPRRRTLLNSVGNVSGSLLIVLGIVLNTSSPYPIWAMESTFYGAVITPCALGLVIACGVAIGLRRPRAEVVAISIETCFQNTGIALTIALATFNGQNRALAAGVPLAYNVVEILFLAVFTFGAWRLNWTYAPPSTPFIKCIVGNFQPRTALELEAAPVTDPEVGAAPALEPASEPAAPSRPAPWVHCFAVMPEPKRRAPDTLDMDRIKQIELLSPSSTGPPSSRSVSTVARGEARTTTESAARSPASAPDAHPRGPQGSITSRIAQLWSSPPSPAEADGAPAGRTMVAAAGRQPKVAVIAPHAAGARADGRVPGADTGPYLARIPDDRPPGMAQSIFARLQRR